MNKLIKEVLACTICKSYLPFPPKPILSVSADARIVIIGQAPGIKVHQSGIPWMDRSGNELRRWLGVTEDQFYNNKLFALMPMGFCYPGRGTSGDLPPRPECAPAWHALLLKKMKHLELTILIGQYSQKYYLGKRLKPTLTETVKSFHEYLPEYLPLVHPSPRNQIWQKKNPWFEKDIVPYLQKTIALMLK
ncbi:MAG: uracil-DNA glycosylase family protein [Bacteroidetes bacterium]|nr:uracil-DNA glycosylase family protein [Bacteroidota bacterium]